MKNLFHNKALPPKINNCGEHQLRFSNRNPEQKKGFLPKGKRNPHHRFIGIFSFPNGRHTGFPTYPIGLYPLAFLKKL